jgi:hypothetical protein
MPEKPVKVWIPPEMFDSDPAGFLEYLGYHGESLGDDFWSITAIQQKDLIRWYVIADESGREHRFDFLDRVPERDPTLDADSVRRIKEMHQLLEERMQSGGDLAALFHFIQSNVLIAQGADEVTATVKDGYAGIGAVPAHNDDPGPIAFPNRSCHLVVLEDTLIRRIRLPGVIFRFDQEPDALATLKAQQAKGGDAVRMFASNYPDVSTEARITDVTKQTHPANESSS